MRQTTKLRKEAAEAADKIEVQYTCAQSILVFTNVTKFMIQAFIHHYMHDKRTICHYGLPLIYCKQRRTVEE